MMKQSKQAFKQGMAEGWKLFWSPFVGAWDEIRATANRPKADNWRAFILNDMRAFFAPLIGAARGLSRAVREILER